MKASGHIQDFLTFLSRCGEEYMAAAEQERSTDKEKQDILHRLELHEDSYHDTARLAKAMRTVRKNRRAAKDTKAMAEPIVKWVAKNGHVVKGLERLLEEVRKAEERIENRSYMERTDVLDGIFGDGHSNRDGAQ